MVSTRSISKKIYGFTLFLFARPISQRLNEYAFRMLLGYLGYMNFSEDFKLTGEKKLLETIGRKEIRHALDIGANQGQWAQLFLSSCDGKLSSFEPQKEAYQELELLGHEYPDRLRLYNIGLGSRSEKMKMNIHESSSELSFINSLIRELPLLKSRTKEVIEIDIRSLDDLYKENPSNFKDIDFIKIDTEGYEFEILSGAKNLISTEKPKYIQLEMNWHQLFTGNSLWDFALVLKDYDVFQLLPYGNKLYEVDPRKPSRNIFQLANFIFVRK